MSCTDDADVCLGYLTVSVSGSDLSSVQVYSDIDGTWTGQSSDTSRGFNTTGTTAVYSLSVNNAATYSEADDMALWGEVVDRKSVV